MASPVRLHSDGYQCLGIDGLLRMATQAGDRFIQCREPAAADEQDTADIELEPAHRIADILLPEPQQGLLRLLLFYIVHINHTVLDSFDLEIAGNQQVVEERENILGATPSPGKSTRISCGERHFKGMGQGTAEKDLAAATRTDEEHLADALLAATCRQGESHLGLLLAADQLIQPCPDDLGTNRRRVRRWRTTAPAFFLIDDGLAQPYAFAADVHPSGTFDQRADVPITLEAEGTVGVAILH